MNMGMAALEYAEKMLRTSERNAKAAARYPYCGEPKNRHDYASPTTCVLHEARVEKSK